MKKFISILLAVIIAFSAVAVGASAYTLGEEESGWIGLDDTAVYTDPGAEKIIPISFAANLTGEAFADVDAATAKLSVPFSLQTDENSPIIKVEAADGFTFEQVDSKESFVDGKIIVPFSAIKDTNSIVVLYVTVKMSADWKVEDYKAEKPVTVKLNEKYLQTGVSVIDKDGNVMQGKGFRMRFEDFTIEATKYKPNFIERAIEWIKQKLTMIPVLFQTLNSYLLNDPLKAPDWVTQAEKRAERDRLAAEEAAAAEAAANQQTIIVA